MRRRGIGRVGRPGLVGTMARTAVVAGTATAVVGGVSRHQQAKAEQAQDAAAYQQEQQAAAYQQAAPAPAFAPAPTGGGLSDESIARLKELGQLKEQGILTDAEFEVQKERILAG